MAKTELPEGFYFDAAKHYYYLDGKKMTGVTTVLGVIAKPQLIPWAARMAADYIREHVAYAIPGEDGGYWAIKPSVVEEAKSAHTKKKEAAGEAGTDIHALVESLIGRAIGMNKGLADGIELEVDAPIKPFIQWAIANKVRFVASEKSVYSKEIFVAGTYDMRLEMDGKTYIADVKTQKAIYDRTPFAQMAAYQFMENEMNEMGESQVDGRLIIHMPKERAFNPETDLYLSEHYEDDLKLFMAALEIYRNMNNRFEPLSAIRSNK